MITPGMHLHPPADPRLRGLSYPPSREPVHTRCFPSHMMHLYSMTSVILFIALFFFWSKTICFWHSSLWLSRRAKGLTCFIARAPWSGFIPGCNIGRLYHRKSPVSMSTQLLFIGATTNFIFVQGGATHTYEAESPSVSLWHCMQAGMRSENNEFIGSWLVWLKIKPFTVSENIFGFSFG